jgi:hypothetical protein
MNPSLSKITANFIIITAEPNTHRVIYKPSNRAKTLLTINRTTIFSNHQRYENNIIMYDLMLFSDTF